MSSTSPLRNDQRNRSWSHEALVSLPARTASPQVELLRRGLLALLLVMVVVAVVWFDRDSYTDNWDGEVSLIDAIYYATVTITTTGYGDITPVEPTPGSSTRSWSPRCGSRSWSCWSVPPWKCWPTRVDGCSKTDGGGSRCAITS